MDPFQAPPPILELHLGPTSPVSNESVPVDPYHRVQHFLQAISRTVPESERHSLLERILQFLSHEDTHLHDYEVEMGADRALCLQLGYLDMLQTSRTPTNDNCTESQHQQYQQQQQQMVLWNDSSVAAGKKNDNYDNHKSNSCEQILICWCLTRIYQCSRQHRLRSFHDIGLTDLIPILTKIMKRCISSAPVNNRPALSHHMDRMVPVLRILRIFAKLGSPVKSAVLRWKNGRLVQVLVEILSPIDDLARSTKEDEIHLVRQSVVVMESLGVLKDLSFRIHDTDKEFMYQFLRETLVHYSLTAAPGTAATAAKVAHFSLHGKLLESVAAIYWNFATAPTLSLEMAQQHMVLKSLEQLLLYKGAGGSEEEVVKINRNALSAFGNVAAALTKESRGMVPSTANIHPQARNHAEAFCNQDWILNTLSHLLRVSSDRDIQRRAMRTIRCLASRAWGREFLFAEGSDLLESLNMVLNSDNSTTFDVSTRVQACETIVCLSGDQILMGKSSAAMEEALVRAISKQKDQEKLDEQAKFVAASCRALSRCLQRRPPGQPTYLPCPDTFFLSLLAYSKAEKEVTHLPIGQLLIQLVTMDFIVKATQSKSCDKPNGDHATQNECVSWQGIMLSTPVLDTAKELLLARGPLFDESQSHALDLIYHFLGKPQNKRILAQNTELLSAMVEYLLASNNDEKKKLAKAMVLEIVPAM